jgi:hypothetical protein
MRDSNELTDVSLTTVLYDACLVRFCLLSAQVWSQQALIFYLGQLSLFSKSNHIAFMKLHPSLIE